MTESELKLTVPRDFALALAQHMCTDLPAETKSSIFERAIEPFGPSVGGGGFELSPAELRRFFSRTTGQASEARRQLRREGKLPPLGPPGLETF